VIALRLDKENAKSGQAALEDETTADGMAVAPRGPPVLMVRDVNHLNLRT
jgi:hypothetical protein